MNKQTSIVSRNQKGELRYNGLNAHIKTKYKSDI